MMGIKLLMAFLAMPLLGITQPTDYVVEGSLSKIHQPLKVVLQYAGAGNTRVSDTLTLQNGAFQYVAQVDRPIKAYLTLLHEDSIATSVRDYLEFYLEPTVVFIRGTDSIRNAVIEGGTANRDLQTLKSALIPLYNELEKRGADYVKARESNDEEALAEFDLLMKRVETEQRANQKAFIRNNPSSPIAVDVVAELMGPMPTYNASIEIFEQLAPQVQESPGGRALLRKITDLKLTEVGSIAPDFSQLDPLGNVVKLSSFRGKYVLLDFWASWCAPCRKENPYLVEVYNMYKDKNFTIFGVSFDNRKADWLKAIADDGLTWIQVSDLKAWKNEVASLYSIHVIPQNFLLDPEGRIVAKNIRGEDLKKILADKL